MIICNVSLHYSTLSTVHLLQYKIKNTIMYGYCYLFVLILSVQRCDLELDELVDTARGICGNDERLSRSLDALFGPAANAYTTLYNSLGDEKEFFGLRDFYAFIKMLVHFGKSLGSRRLLTRDEVEYAVRRNFDGFPKSDISPLQIFMEQLGEHCSTGRSNQLPQDSNTPLGNLDQFTQF